MLVSCLDHFCFGSTRICYYESFCLFLLLLLLLFSRLYHLASHLARQCMQLACCGWSEKQWAFSSLFVIARSKFVDRVLQPRDYREPRPTVRETLGPDIGQPWYWSQNCDSLGLLTTTPKKSSTTFQISWTISSMTGSLALRNTQTAEAMHLGILMRARHDVATEANPDWGKEG